MSTLEIFANVFNLISVLLARRNSIQTWPTGIIACVLFAALFFQVKLYADVSLQVFFIMTSFYGLWKWKFGSPEKSDLPITTLKLGVFVGLLILAAVLTIAYGSALHFWTDASFPFIDSIVLMLSIIAQLLLMGRKIENWLVWIAVNLVAVPLYASKELYLTSGIYFLFLLNAIWGWLTWQRLLKAQA